MPSLYEFVMALMYNMTAKKMFSKNPLLVLISLIKCCQQLLE